MCLKKKNLFFSLLSPSPCDECPFIKHCCTTFSQPARWDDYDLCSLWLLSSRHPWSFLKSSENNARCKRGFPINSSPLPFLPALIYQSVEWKLRRNDTSPSSAHLSLSEVSPLIKKLSLIQSNFPLWYSYHLGENTVVFVCVHNLTPHHESAS